VKIKVYILTWKDAEALNKNLYTLFYGYNFLPNGVDIQVNIINNHTDFKLDPTFTEHVNVIHNRATPDFATAMIARMWNTAIIHGFQDLNNPDADIVVTSQDDTIWNPDWISKLLHVMEKNTFYADDAGDMVCAYKPEAVKEIGLWDERFHYGFGEGDYFLRAIRWNADKSSINDHAHGRVWNKTLHLAKRPDPTDSRYTEQNRSHQFRGLSWAMWVNKWPEYLEGNWLDDVKYYVDLQQVVPQYILYPYFEMNVNNLRQKGYIVPDL
jgi:hypothetical protein